MINTYTDWLIKFRWVAILLTLIAVAVLTSGGRFITFTNDYQVFFGESMFARKSNASKFGFISLVRRLKEEGFKLIDCQQETPHLASLGARSIPREGFLKLLEENRQLKTQAGSWTLPQKGEN